MKKKTKKLIGIFLLVYSVTTLSPCYFLPTDAEFWFLFLMPYIGIWAVIIPFALAIVFLPLGLWLMGLPLNGFGIKKAIRTVLKKIRKK